VYVRDPAIFSALPNAIVGYDLPDFLLSALADGLSLASSGFCAFTGHQFRTEKHFRVWWEISLSSPPLVHDRLFNGSGYAPYTTGLRNVLISDIALDRLPRDSSTTLRNKEKHQLPGVCFGKRGDVFCCHVLPSGYFFSLEGLAIPIEDETKAIEMLGVLNTPLARFAINKFCGQHKTSGYVNLFPYRNGAVASKTTARIRSLAESHNRIRGYDETQPFFSVLARSTVRGFGSQLAQQLSDTRKETLEVEAQCHEEVLHAYKVSLHERQELEAFRRRQPELELPIEDADLDDECGRFAAHSFVSHALGCVFGRWDVRKRLVFAPSSIFACMPRCPPAMLLGTDGVPATGSACVQDYPFELAWRGILPDDAGHEEDVTHRVLRMLDVLCEGCAEQNEAEIQTAVGATLREYLRKPNKGGFWAEHLKRYSKAGRRAPIYWLLQSSKRNYALWLYYHRLDKDLLFKALLNYVEPKVQRENNRLKDMGRQKQAAGGLGKGRKKLDKDIERQEDLISELRDFEDKLRRAANLHLEPDLNDGVVLNIAPLQELVPWKEAKNYWDELLEGKYERSAIGKQLRQKGIVK
jgi:hypothetical protein